MSRRLSRIIPYRDEYAKALRVLSPAGRRLLIAQYHEPEHAVTSRRLGELMGYSGDANIQYGKLGHLVAEQLNVVPDTFVRRGVPSPMWWQVLSIGHPLPDIGFVWVMRGEVAAAVEQLGWVKPATKRSVARHEKTPGSVDDEIAEARQRGDFDGLTETEIERLIQARRGQGRFRRELEKMWNGRCPVTGARLSVILVASHAKPWRVSTNAERLDPNNGVLLEAGVDRLFDAGLVGFEANGTVLRSSRLDVSALGDVVLPARAPFWPTLSQSQKRYLRWHRESVFTR